MDSHWRPPRRVAGWIVGSFSSGGTGRVVYVEPAYPGTGLKKYRTKGAALNVARRRAARGRHDLMVVHMNGKVDTYKFTG